MPLPQAWTISAGSVFVFPAGAKDRLEDTGSDRDRQPSGGWVWPGGSEYASDGQPDSNPIEPAPPSGQRGGAFKREQGQLAERLSERQLRLELDHYIARRISDLCLTNNAFSHLPKSSQLMRARLAARKAVQTGSLDVITEHFNGLTDLGKRSWMQAKIGGDNLKNWIDQQVAAAGNFNLDSAPKVAGVQAKMTPALRNQTVARIIEGVLKQAAKHSSRSEEGGVK